MKRSKFNVSGVEHETIKTDYLLITLCDTCTM